VIAPLLDARSLKDPVRIRLLSFRLCVSYVFTIMRSSVNSMVIKLPLLLPQPSLPSNMVPQEFIATISLSTLTVD
jgi:hypothetical protein